MVSRDEICFKSSSIITITTTTTITAAAVAAILTTKAKGRRGERVVSKSYICGLDLDTYPLYPIINYQGKG